MLGLAAKASNPSRFVSRPTSKITFARRAVSSSVDRSAASPEYLRGKKSIGPDKISQRGIYLLRRRRWGTSTHMCVTSRYWRQFALVAEVLDQRLSESRSPPGPSPKGGYFISVDIVAQDHSAGPPWLRTLVSR